MINPAVFTATFLAAAVEVIEMVIIVVGTLLSAFGSFRAVEGLGIAWPGGDLFIIALAAWYVLAAAWYIRRLQRQTPLARQLTPQHAGES